MDFSKGLKDARKLAGLTQDQLAEGCGLATITIRQYESGKREPRYDTVQKIAAYLHVSVGSLLGGGNTIKCKAREWASRKDSTLNIKIDSELLQTINSFAEFDSIPLEDEVEKLLLEYTELLMENNVDQ